MSEKYNFTYSKSIQKFNIPNNPDIDLHQQEMEKMISVCLGLIGISFNLISIFIYARFKYLKKSAKGHELITYINISSLFNIISHLLLFDEVENSFNQSTLCLIQGPMMVYSEISEIFTASILSLNIYNDIRSRVDKLRRKERFKYITIGFLIPFIIISPGIIFDIFGKNGHFCWILPKFDKNIGLIYYIFIWICLIGNLIIIILTYFCVGNGEEMLNDFSIQSRENIRSQIRKMLVYPILFIFCWIFPTIDRFMFFFSEKKCYIIEVLNISSISLLGVLISLISFIYFHLGGFTIYRVFCSPEENWESNSIHPIESTRTL